MPLRKESGSGADQRQGVVRSNKSDQQPCTCDSDSEEPAAGSTLCANVRETGSPVEFNVEGGGVMMHDPLSQKNAGRRFLGNGRST